MQDVEHALGGRRARLEVQARVPLHVRPGDELQRVGAGDRRRDLGEVTARSTRPHLDIGVARHVECVVGRERERLARPSAARRWPRSDTKPVSRSPVSKRSGASRGIEYSRVRSAAAGRRSSPGQSASVRPLAAVRAPHHTALHRQVRAHDVPPGLMHVEPVRLTAAPRPRAASAAGPRRRRGRRSQAAASLKSPLRSQPDPAHQLAGRPRGVRITTSWLPPCSLTSTSAAGSTTTPQPSQPFSP